MLMQPGGGGGDPEGMGFFRYVTKDILSEVSNTKPLTIECTFPPECLYGIKVRSTDNTTRNGLYGWDKINGGYTNCTYGSQTGFSSMPVTVSGNTITFYVNPNSQVTVDRFIFTVYGRVID